MRFLLALLALAALAPAALAQTDSTGAAAPVSADAPGEDAPRADTLAAEAADLITLGFGWTPGLAATVTATQERVRYSPDDSTDTFVAATMRMTVAAADSVPDALRVAYSDFALDRVIVPADSAVAAEAEALVLREVASLLPTLLVGGDGAFLGLADTDTVQQALRAMLADALADTSAAALADALLSEEALAAAAQQEWGLLVGFWDGAALDVGALYEMDDEAAMPGVPGVRMPLRVEFGVAGRLPCPDDTADGDADGGEAESPAPGVLSGGVAADTAAVPDCVELVYRSYPEEAQMRAVIATLFEALAPDQQDEMRAFFDALRSFSAMTEVRLVTEPATLVPHALVRTKEVTLETVATDAEPGGTAYQFEQRAYRYSYADAPGEGTSDDAGETPAPVDG